MNVNEMTADFISINEFFQFFDRIFFGQQYTIGICVFRVFTGLLILLETLIWQGKNKKFLTVDGWFGIKDFENSMPKFSVLHYLPKTNRSLNLVFIIQFFAGVCLTIGLFPNFAALICYVTLVSIHARNSYVLSSGDTVYRFFTLFLVFAPCSGQLSVMHDAVLNLELTSWPWVVVILRIFVANIYLKNVLFKLKGKWWVAGIATQRVFNARIWNRFGLPNFLDNTFFFRLSNYGTLAIETALFTLIWFEEFRWIVITLGVIFHLFLWIFLRFGFFQLTMLVGLTLFIKSEEYISIIKKISLLTPF